MSYASLHFSFLLLRCAIKDFPSHPHTLHCSDFCADDADESCSVSGCCSWPGLLFLGEGGTSMVEVEIWAWERLPLPSPGLPFPLSLASVLVFFNDSSSLLFEVKKVEASSLSWDWVRFWLATTETLLCSKIWFLSTGISFTVTLRRPSK